MLMDAMKSAGPKMIVSRRGEAPAISSTFTRPLAFSICASMPIRPTSKPMVFSICVSSRSSATICWASCTFGSMMQSRFGPAPSTTVMTSRYVQCVVQSLTRTTRVLPVQSPSFSASTMVCRAPSLASGAQASSRSRKTWSAGRPWAFSRKRGLLPGTARQERRGRSGSAGASGVVGDGGYGGGPGSCGDLQGVELVRLPDLVDDTADDLRDTEVLGGEHGRHSGCPERGGVGGRDDAADDDRDVAGPGRAAAGPARPAPARRASRRGSTARRSARPRRPRPRRSAPA